MHADAVIGVTPTGWRVRGRALLYGAVWSAQRNRSATPALHPNATTITGVICGVRIEEIDHPLMPMIRCSDKLVDELAKGRPMLKILRS